MKHRPYDAAAVLLSIGVIGVMVVGAVLITTGYYVVEGVMLFSEAVARARSSRRPR